MDTEDSDSGLDELMRLQQQFTRQQKEDEDREKQRAEQGKKVRGVLQGLRELNLSMAIEQLKPVAKPEIIEKVNALAGKEGTEELRKIISGLADNIESQLGAVSASDAEGVPLVDSMRTLNILMDLYFSLQ
jgi:hypothetical protein